jgi:hypothetical protein
MNKKIIFSFLLFPILFMAHDAISLELLDGKVVIHGKISEQVLMRARNIRYDELYDYTFYHFRSTLKLETMWHASDAPGNQINIYGVWKNYYDMAHEIDSGYNNYLRRFSGDTDKGIQELKSYDTFTDICRELYFELTRPKFQFRIGKQIVAWGDMGFERMADIVNPVDLRGNLNPAYPDFAEIKRGLFMYKLYLTPDNLPMDMDFELLVIPEFQPTRNPPAGYHVLHPAVFNNFKNPNDQFRANYRDQPSNWRKPEFGGRIEGNLNGYNWTLQYLHHRLDDSIIRSGKALQANLPSVLGIGRAKDVKEYPWYDSFGFTLNKPIDRGFTLIPCTNLRMTGNLVRFEGIYDLNKKCNALSGGIVPNVKVKEYDRWAYALEWSTKIFLPKITPYFRNKLLSSSTQLMMEWVPDKHRSYQFYPYVTYHPEDHHWTMLAQTLSYELWNGRVIPAIYAVHYFTQGGGYFAPAIAFKPQFGWTFLVRYLNYSGLYRDVNSKDNLTFEITYEF